MQYIVLIYSDKIKYIFRSWQQRSTVCFGVASAKGKKLQYLLYGIYSFSNLIKYGGERMNFLRYFCADWHFPVVFFREGKSGWNVLATKTTMEEKLSGKSSNITFPPNIILGTLSIYFFSGLRAFQMPCSYIKKQLRRNSL